MIRYCKKILTVLFAGTLVLLASWNVASAMTATCDPAYYSALSARGWMQGQREVAVQQSLIPKPDSILEYTCFDEFMYVLASNALSVFTENEIWYLDFASVTDLVTLGIDMTAMDRALQDLVGEALGPYIDTDGTTQFPYLKNFTHNRNLTSSANTFLGGRTNLKYRLKAVHMGHDPEHPTDFARLTSGYNYQCDAMRDVWIAARCFHANQEMSIDDYFPMSQYPNATYSAQGAAATFPGNAWDPRQSDLSARLQGGNCTTANPRWRNNYFRIGTNDPGYAGRYQNQIVAAQTGFYGTGPASCSGTACCPTPPIPTGIQVTRGVGSDLKNYMEFICVNAGCAFQRGGNGTATTPQATGSCTRNPPQ